MHETLSPFVIGLIACFVGGIPFGMINLTVTDLSLRKGVSSALGAAAGASMVEIGQAWLALFFGSYVTSFLTENAYLNLVFAGVLLILGIIFWVRKEKPDMTPVRKRRVRGGSFIKGMTVAALNPQAVPFWLFVLAWLSTSMKYAPGADSFLFLVGVFFGKLLILSVYALSARTLTKRLGFACNCANKILGSIFLILAAVQLYKYL